MPTLLACASPVLGTVIVKVLKRKNNLIQLRELACIVDDTNVKTHSTLSRRTTSIRGLRHEDFSTPYAPTSDSSFHTPLKTTPIGISHSRRRHARDVAHAILDANAAAVPLLAAIASHRDEILRDAAAYSHLAIPSARLIESPFLQSHTERVLGQPHVWRVGGNGGGSIRIPTAFNGVTRIKATLMRIPDLVRTDPSIANVGPIATTVQDAAVAYAVLSGSHPDFPMSQVQPPPHVDFSAMNAPLASIRIVPHHRPGAEEGGATVVPMSLPNMQTIHHSHGLTILTEMLLNAERYGGLVEYSYKVQIALTLPKLGYSSAELLASQVVRGYATTRLVNKLFENVDVVLTPTTPTLAPRIDPAFLTHSLSDITTTLTLMRFILVGNLAGYTSQGLPTSMLVQADHWNEHVSLQVARKRSKP
ncbi:hypothetical protein DYB30_001460 [Aphanomyces astaci]|uniref:Amidase domain-containing protein n=1 Tax=Aphanomyces astaci TaxID=112090 RepID=A0A397DHH3_APHAT|nr:hypothetical protein DYB30_001460 [Aphanomyces astaci]